MEKAELLKEQKRLAKELKQTLLRHMKKHNMNQDNIASNTKFDPSYICKIMNEKCLNPKRDSLIELALVFNCRLKESFEPIK